MGVQSEIIDYVRKDEEFQNVANTLADMTPQWNKGVKRWLFIKIKTTEFLVSSKRFLANSSKYLKLSSRRYSSLNELQSAPPDSDIYMTGSDQVWGGISCLSYDSAYFLNWGANNIRRLAYAASFGNSDMNDDRKQACIKYLSRYDGLTVREKSAKIYLEQLNIKNVKQVLDPTLLLTKDVWLKVVERECCKKRIRGEYILIYQRRPNKMIDQYAKDVSERMGLPLYRISADFNQLFRPGKLIFLPNFREFVNAIANASLIITDSFHGTAFAINMNVPFIDILPERTATRILSLLELCGLEKRVVRDMKDFGILSEEINFEKTNKLISMERDRSINILKDMIGELI
jgi:hypothetical protein